MLDARLGGGWPQGKVGELTGRASSGRSAVAAATVAAATARGEVTAWLDPADAFDPVSAAAAGVDLARVLWVRPRGIEETVRAAELVLETGGFTVVVLDLGSAALESNRDVASNRAGGGKPRPYIDGATDDSFGVGTPPAAARATSGTGGGVGPGFAIGRRRGQGALRLRLARAAERAGAVALVLAERPWAGTLAGVTVALGRSEAHWGGEGREPRWLDGVVLSAQVERGRVGAGDQAAARESDAVVRMAPFCNPCHPEERRRRRRDEGSPRRRTTHGVARASVGSFGRSAASR